jgi:hypothetical protein
MSIHELMEMWDKRTEYNVEPSTYPPNDESEEYDLEASNATDVEASAAADDEASAAADAEASTATDVLAYREIIFTSPVYQWLLAILRREFYVSPAEQDCVTEIRKTVLHHLPSTHRVSRKKSSESYTVGFHMNWDPLKFFTEQEYRISADKTLLRALTFTAASDSHAQCLPCLNYLRQMWPSTGESFIEFISAVLRNPSVVNRGKTLPTIAYKSMYATACCDKAHSQ